MCNSKCFDVVSIIVSLLLGIGMAILIYFFPALFGIGIALAFLIALLALFILTLAATSLLRKDTQFNACLCSLAQKLLIPALLLLAAGTIGLIFAALNVAATITFPIVSFILYSLLAYTLFSIYCLLSCLMRTGCGHCGCGHES